jgi:uncharacterized protein YodC (DUF2158 family)
MADPAHQFKPGDEVEVKETGRRMTVKEVEPPLFVYRIKCAWKEGSGEKVDYFRPDELRHVKG